MAKCNCVPAGNPSVIGAAVCPIHGMKILREVLSWAWDYAHAEHNAMVVIERCQEYPCPAIREVLGYDGAT